jgi:ABC-type multidrug transport system fused ATPase/permease subunit
VGENALKLEAVVAERGGNYSAGQAQLLSLARAILRLRTASIVLCDEVTASVDYQTDRLIQDTLRTAPAFRDCTIVTIAHRLRTIADYDMVCVVSAGEVAELGSPADLLKNKSSLFYSLCEESNELGDIMTLAGL